uniref:Bromodomain and WD repeat-containing protein 1 n=1 Tax=Schistocephalus solidus TaxID=70667 RepID=A0A183SHY7_SCHSO
LHWVLNSQTDDFGVPNTEKLPPLRPPSKRGHTGSHDNKPLTLERHSSSRKLSEVARNASQTVHVISTNEIKDPEAEMLERKKADMVLDKVIRKLKPSLRSRSLQPLPTKSTDTESEGQDSLDNLQGSEGLNNNQREDMNVSNSLLKKNIEIASFLSAEFRGFEMFSPAVERTFYVEPGPRPGDDNLQFKFLPDSPGIKLPCGQQTTHVPPRKILPLKTLPRDPLAKLRLEARLFSMGFRQPLVTQSNVTENDQPQMHHVALVQLCEAYTKNMGEAFLYAMARESIDVVASSSDEEVEWTNGEKQKIVDDPTERLWNWDSSLPSSRRLRETRETEPTVTSKPPPPVSTISVGSLGPDDNDAKSDLSALLMIESDGTTECDYDEQDFIEGHQWHPFLDPLIVAGFRHRSKPRERYQKRRREKKNQHEVTGSMISEIHSDMPDEIPDAFPSTTEAVSTGRLELPPSSTSPKPDSTASVLSTPRSSSATSLKDESLMAAEHLSKDESSVKNETPDTTANPVKKKRPAKRLHHKVEEKPTEARRGIPEAVKKKINISAAGDFPMDKTIDLLETGFDNVAINWEKASFRSRTLSASHAPNPMRWFQTLDAMEFDAAKSTNSDGDNKKKDIEGYGLGKRFSSLTGGLEKLVNLLDATVENDQPKAELLLDSMVKQHVLDMPLVVGNPERIRELYKSTVLKDPMLYKMVMRRRDILPQDLQNFVNKILEITESSNEMLAALHPSMGNRKLITDAAKEMFASGFLSGGPKCPFENPATKKHITEVNLGSALSDDDTEIMPSELEPEKGEEAGETSRIMNYTNDVDYEKAFKTSIRNPSRDVLEEVAYFLPEFAFHIRPLFELKWEKICTDTYPETLLPELAELRNLRRTRLNIMKSVGLLSAKQEEKDAEDTRRLCKNLVSRLCKLLRGPAGMLPGSGAWIALLATLHGIMMWPPLGDFLVRKMNYWLPVLLLTLFNRYPSVREEGCCVLAFLVSCYPLFTRLHYHSRQLLVSNVTFALLDAMDKNKDSYAYFHGVLGYMLHSIPCAAPMECIVLWAPEVMKRKNSLVARDWPRFIYYMAKQWPAHCLRWSVIVQRRLLRVLELGLSKKRSKYSARLALGYYQRRTRELSFVATCWRSVGES